MPTGRARLRGQWLGGALVVLGLAAAAPPPAAVGSPAPEFRLQDQRGDWHSLAEYRGHWVVLYFYPKDGTPGCTTEACALRDNVFAFRKLNAVVLGVSVDDVDSHREFAAKHSLPFTRLRIPASRPPATTGCWCGCSASSNSHSATHFSSIRGG